ncbi:MAG: T9SS type A sorting domain-containing protein, partial [Candidatus Sabulitectum sp.]|nr:T9SS type A sorting domain-containing protein [Candidatus Sabulitectum sp.]
PVSCSVEIGLEPQDESSTITIHDISGRIVETVVLRDGKTVFDVSNLPPGVYSFRSSNGDTAGMAVLR